MAKVEKLSEVTEAQWETIVADLSSNLKVKQKEEEAVEAYAGRLAGAANKADDDVWEDLEEASQLWVNGALEAIELDKPIPLPKGLVSAKADEPAPAKAKGKAKAKAEEEEATPPAKAKGKAKAKADTPPAKAKAKAKAGNGAKRGRKGLFEDDAVITPLKKANPYRDGTKGAAWYDKYEKGMTVEAAIKAGVPRPQIRFDMNKEYVRVK